MLEKRETWNYPPFNFDESGDAQPVLILGTTGQGARRWKFKPGREWHWIDHQAAGVGCHHPEFVCTILPWREGMRERFAALADLFDGSNAGVFGVPLSMVNKYASALLTISPALSCETTYDEFIEAVYPVDATAAAIQELTTDPMPDDLNSLVEWDSELNSFIGCVGRWRLYVLSQNSD